MVTYELTSKKIKGEFTITFIDGFLNGIKMEFKERLNEAQHEALFGRLPFAESDINTLELLGFTIVPVKNTYNKLSMFCYMYMMYVGVKYKVSAADAGKMKHINVTEAILMHYFKSDNFIFKGKHSINNICKYWNELLAEIANADKNKYPDHWTEGFENKLDNKQRGEYWAHLRSLGLQPKKDRTGNTIDWVKK